MYTLLIPTLALTVSVAILLVIWVDWKSLLTAFWYVLSGRPIPPVETPQSTLQHDYDRISPYDGMPTDWLSLEERRSLDRLTDAGVARREPLRLGVRVVHLVVVDAKPTTATNITATDTPSRD